MAFIPVWPIWVWAYYRIGSLKRGIVPMLVALAISISLQMTLPYPYGIVFFLFIGPIPVYFTLKKWTVEWNARFSRL